MKRIKNYDSLYITHGHYDVAMADRREQEKKEENANQGNEKGANNPPEENIEARPSSEEKKEGEGAEKEVKPKGEEPNKHALIKDIMANNAIEPAVEEEDIEFKKVKVIEEEEFSWINLDRYLHSKYRHWPASLRILIEIVLTQLVLMTPPLLTGFLIMPRDEFYDVFITIFDGKPDNDPIVIYIRTILFLTLAHTVYTLIMFLAEHILYFTVTVFGLLKIPMNEYAIELIQVINATSWWWTQAMVSLVFFYIGINVFPEYDLGKKVPTTEYIVVTALLCYGVVMCVLFIEKLIMAFLTSEIRRQEYRDRIWNINYKTFIFKKLAALSEASPGERRALASEMASEFDPGFFLKYSDLRLNSQKAAENVAESIFGYLEIKRLLYEDIEKFFPDNPDEVYRYLSGSETADEKKVPITFEQLRERAVALYQDRTDITYTLHARDRVINKLDIILMSIALYFSVILVMVILGVEYKVFLASMGPNIVAFSWIFSDTIKEIYNCFVFLLVNHPFDFGDRVVIDNEELKVTSVDLLSTSFVGENDVSVFIPNISLIKKEIHNIRRSSKQWEILTVKIGGSTTFGKALQLQDKVVEELGKHHKLFTGDFTIKNFSGGGDPIALTVAIKQQMNLQDTASRQARRKEMIKIMEEKMKAVGISYLNSFEFKN
jgi:small-conductance mechanosensitive channel